MAHKAQATWGGRFSAGPAGLMLQFSESVSFDARLALFDLAGSRAHSAMLAHVGLITPRERDAIHRGLDALGREVRAGKFKWRAKLEDVHMNIEHALTKRVPAAAKLHTARSRNDQVATDMRLYFKAACAELVGHAAVLAAAVRFPAEKIRAQRRRQFRRGAIAFEQREQILLPRLAAVKLQLEQARKRARRRSDVRLLCITERSGPVLDVADEALDPGLVAVGRIVAKKLLGELGVIAGHFFGQRGMVVRPELDEQRCGLVRGADNENAVALTPRRRRPFDILPLEARRNLVRGRLHHRGVGGQFLAPVPLVQARDLRPQLAAVLIPQIKVILRHHAHQGIGVVVGQAHHGAGREQAERRKNECEALHL